MIPNEHDRAERGELDTLHNPIGARHGAQYTDTPHTYKRWYGGCKDFTTMIPICKPEDLLCFDFDSCQWRKLKSGDLKPIPSWAKSEQSQDFINPGHGSHWYPSSLPSRGYHEGVYEDLSPITNALEKLNSYVEMKKKFPRPQSPLLSEGDKARARWTGQHQ